MIAGERDAARLKIGQYELYRRIAISPNTWARLKRGDNAPNMRTHDRILAVLDELAAEVRALPENGEDQDGTETQ